ncbi:MAG TPA: hypothetical protein VKZ53_25470 [Candidatus Angelobacter sp.]|nr:hypothetical protein [Candidatus Angelobacter sp.]
MSTMTPVTKIGGDAEQFPNVQVIWVDYDETTGVTVNPTSAAKGTMVIFKNSQGAKLKIDFLSPTGHGFETVSDSELCLLTIGGVYHFRCTFTFKGSDGDYTPTSGGLMEVSPPRP